ncbi:hypothetical protein PTKIN_Ptkin08bG0054400 [Pterospermum kingtungense]
MEGIFSNLPAELIPEILLRLPGRSLLRFNSNRDRILIKRNVDYDCRSEEFSLSLLSRNDLVVEDLMVLSYKREEYYSRSPDSCYCDGIICFKDPQGDMLLCNPTIRESMELPKSSPNYEHEDIVEYSIGFGYDSKSHQYKIVRISRYAFHPEKCKVEIYTLGTNS